MLLILFSIFCGLLVGLCLLATIVEILSARRMSYNETERVENGGHISMDKDPAENTPLLLPDTTTSKEKKNEGKTINKENIYNHLFRIIKTEIGRIFYNNINDVI